MKRILPLALAVLTAALFSSCSTFTIDDLRLKSDESPPEIEVDISDSVLYYGGREIPIETGRAGVGNTFNSKKTPVGSFVIYQKQARHRFARDGMGVLRMKDPVLSGKTKHEPGRRGVHIHRNLDGKAEGTNGCICPIYDHDYRYIWTTVSAGTRVNVRL